MIGCLNLTSSDQSLTVCVVIDMSRSVRYFMVNESVRGHLLHFIQSLPMDENKPMVISISEPKRTLAQNAKMWAMLSDISEQVEWYGVKMSDDDWKNVLSAGLEKQRAVPGIDGGFVMLGAKTSQQSVKWMSDMIELCYAFGAEHGVKWSDKAMEYGYRG